MTFSKSAKDMTLCNVLGKTVKPGSLIRYIETKPCPCCRQGTLNVYHDARIVQIELYPGTGFAEVGDDMLMYLDNGHMLRGDSENGFWSIKEVLET